MKKTIKNIIILFFVFTITINAFAITSNEEDIEKYRDEAMAGRICNGFWGVKSEDYSDFISDINAVSIVSNRGNVAYVCKKMNSKNLLLGHSIVAFCGDSLIDEHIDVVGVAGGRLFYAEQLLNKMPMDKYKNIVIWLGINDVLYYKYDNKSDEEIFSNVTSAYYSLYQKYKDLDAKIYFMSISPTSDYSLNVVIHRINQYINMNFNMIDSKYFPDLNEHHFYTTTFRKIYDEQIKPVIENNK